MNEEEIVWGKNNSNLIAKIQINKEPSITEIWYEGSVVLNNKSYPFWLIEPKNCDYELECRWFFKVPKEVRALSSKIIEAFKQQNGYE